MDKFRDLREAELRVLMQHKAESILLRVTQPSPREYDDIVIAELAAEISALAVQVAKQNNRVN